MAIEFEIHEFFRRPPDQVFAALTDLEAARQWMPGFVGLERLDDGALGVGSEWRETRKIFGKQATEQFEVTVHEPPKRLVVRVDGSKGSSKSGEYIFEYRLQPDQGGTRLYLGGEIHGSGVLATLIGWVMVFPFKKACAKDLRALKSHLETA